MMQLTYYSHHNFIWFFFLDLFINLLYNNGRLERRNIMEIKGKSSSPKTNLLQMIENFGDLLKNFTSSEEPIPLLTELNASWQQILIMLNEEQKKPKLCSSLVEILMLKLELIYGAELTSKTKKELEELRGDIHYITYCKIYGILFQIKFLLDGSEDFSTSFNIECFNESLLCFVEKELEFLRTTEQVKTQKPDMKILQDSYKLLVQQYLAEK